MPTFRHGEPVTLMVCARKSWEFDTERVCVLNHYTMLFDELNIMPSLFSHVNIISLLLNLVKSLLFGYDMSSSSRGCSFNKIYGFCKNKSNYLAHLVLNLSGSFSCSKVIFKDSCSLYFICLFFPTLILVCSLVN